MGIIVQSISYSAILNLSADVPEKLNLNLYFDGYVRTCENVVEGDSTLTSLIFTEVTKSDSALFVTKCNIVDARSNKLYSV